MSKINKKSWKLIVVTIVMLSMLVLSVSTALAWQEGSGTNWYYVDASYGGYHNSVPLVIEIDGDSSEGQVFNLGDVITITGDLHAYAAMCAGAGNEALTDASIEVSGPSGPGSDTAGGYDSNNTDCAEVETIDTLTITYTINSAGMHTIYMYSYADAASWMVGDNEDFVEDLLTFEVAVNNPPIADANGPYLVAVSHSVTLDGSGSSDPDGDPLSFSWVLDGPALGEIADSTFTAYDQTGITNVILTVEDGRGGIATDTAMVVVYDPDGGFVTGGGWIWSQAAEAMPVFSNIPDPFPGSFPSLGYEATSTDEAGDHIEFAGEDRNLSSVLVSLTNWSCENDFDYVDGIWLPNRDGIAGEACLTTPGSGFSHPITFNIYEVDNSGTEPAVGSLIVSKTDTYFISFRPSWDDENCTGNGETPDTDIPFGGKWYDPVLGFCVHGYNTQIEFDFSTDGVVLPNEVIYGVEYNTGHHGDAPIGINGPYNSLNLGLDTSTPLIGNNIEAEDIFWDTSYAPFYCDGGAGGVDTFRRDWDSIGCWGGYTPVVQFNTLTEGAYKPDPNLEGKANFGFVSKYKKGADVPTGNTEFQFKAGDLNFHSSSYEWLLVTGSNFAKFKGTGTVNGEGEYKFMLWAGDGYDVSGADTFRIKIWWEEGETEHVVYDNGMNQAIEAGNIVIHTKK